FIMQCSGEAAQVVTEGLKDFGVECSRLTIPEPVKGARVTVTGIVDFGQGSRSQAVLLVPRSSEDVQLQSPVPLRRGGLSTGLALTLSGLGLMGVALSLNRLRRRKGQSLPD
ncbi:MAG TPA: hypothetical protein VGS41_14790, partial [Chthonomonadales bacterium]|nr:hypothetical protein [Chthonomonadales bacterium]